MALDQTRNFPPQPGCQPVTNVTYFCGLCPQKYNREDLLRKHVLTHSDAKRPQCSCGFHLEGLDIYGYDRPVCTEVTLQGLLELVRHSHNKATRIVPGPRSEDGREGDILPLRSARLNRLAATSSYKLLTPASPLEMREVAQGGVRPAMDAREGPTIYVSNGTRDSSSMTTQPKQCVGDEDDDYDDDDLLPEPTGEHPVRAHQQWASLKRKRQLRPGGKAHKRLRTSERNASKTTATLEVGDGDQSQDHGDEPDSRVLSEEVSESQAHHQPGEASSVHSSPTAAKCSPNAIQQQPMSLNTGQPRDSESSGDDRDFGPSGGDECANYDYDGGGDYGDDNTSVTKGQSPPTPSRGKDSSLIGVLNGAASIRPKRDQPRSGEDETTAKRQRVGHKQQETECAATQMVQDQGQSQGMQTGSLGEAEAKTELERKISALKAWQQNLKEHFKKMAEIEEESIRSLECLEKELDDVRKRRDVPEKRQQPSRRCKPSSL